MEIDESKILNRKYCNEEMALACLIASGVCLLYNHNVGTKENYINATVVCVNASDVFGWALADAEEISNSDGDESSEIIALYQLWKENNKWGVVKWLCIKRNQQPQFAIKRDMKKDGYWDSILESLPENEEYRINREANKTKEPSH